MDLEDFVVTDLPDEVAATLTDTAVVEEAPPLMDLAVRLGWVVCAALCLFVVSGGIAAVIR
jgi:hypothetical protein